MNQSPLTIARTGLSLLHEQRACFYIPVAQLGYYDTGGSWFVEAGEFEFMAGGNSRDVLRLCAAL